MSSPRPACATSWRHGLDLAQLHDSQQAAALEVCLACPVLLRCEREWLPQYLEVRALERDRRPTVMVAGRYLRGSATPPTEPVDVLVSGPSHP